MEIWVYTCLTLIVHIRAWQCCVMTYSCMERSLKIISRVYEVAIYFRYVIVFKLKRIMPDRLMNRDSRISYPPWRSCSPTSWVAPHVSVWAFQAPAAAMRIVSRALPSVFSQGDPGVLVTLSVLEPLLGSRQWRPVLAASHDQTRPCARMSA